jgi:hypothetical protein
LRRQRAIPHAAFDAQLVHHFAQYNGRFVQRSVRLTTLASRRIERRFPQTIIQQDQTTVSLETELRQANGVGPKVKTDQARCDSHQLNFQIPKLKSQTNFKL